MALRDELERAIEAALERQPAAQQAVFEGDDRGRGEADDAIQDVIAARNALLDAAARWDRATQST